MALIEFLVDIFQEPIIQLIAVLGAFGIGIFQGIILGCARPVPDWMVSQESQRLAEREHILP